jgi:hypothetical protein
MKDLGRFLVVVLFLGLGLGLASTGAAQDPQPAGPAREAEPSGDKDRIAKTVEEIRTLATALDAYAVDYNRYPAGTLDDLEKVLVPTYVERMPRLDAWETPFRVEVTEDAMNCRITSAGADRKFEKRGPAGCPEDKARVLDLTDPARDLVFYGGEFVQLVK